MKKIYVIIAIALTLCVFAGCSQTVKENQNTDNSKPEVETSSNADSSFSESKEEIPSEPADNESSQKTTETQSQNTQSSAVSQSNNNSSSAATQKTEIKPQETIKPTEPAKQPDLTPPPTPDPTPTLESPQPTFDINYWVQFAKDYGANIGLTLDSSVTGSWDNPITASSTSKYLERDIKGRLDWYKNDFGYKYFYVWSEQRTDGKFNIFISYG